MADDLDVRIGLHWAFNQCNCISAACRRFDWQLEPMRVCIGTIPPATPLQEPREQRARKEVRRLEIPAPTKTIEVCLQARVAGRFGMNASKDRKP